MAEKVTVAGRDFYFPDNLKGIPGNPTSIAHSLHSRWERQRDILFKLPQHDEGIDLDRIHRFRERIGINEIPLLILRPHHYAEARRITGQVNSTSNHHGAYLYGPEVIAVEREPEIEELNGGPKVTESFAVHEIAHSGVPAKVTVFERKVKPRRWPLKDRVVLRGRDIGGVYTEPVEGSDTGLFWEEGYAELERGYYLEESLGMTTGFGVKFQSNELPMDLYTYKAYGDDGLVYSAYCSGSIAASAIRQLIEYDPQLLPAIRESRRSVPGLLGFVDRVNTLLPQLYENFRAVSLDDPLSEAQAYHAATLVLEHKRSMDEQNKDKS